MRTRAIWGVAVLGAVLGIGALIVSRRPPEPGEPRTPYRVCARPAPEGVVLVADPGGCMSSSYVVTAKPRIDRTAPNIFLVEGELRHEWPKAGGPTLSDCNGGRVSAPFANLPAGRYSVQGAATFDFELPLDREKCSGPDPGQRPAAERILVGNRRALQACLDAAPGLAAGTVRLTVTVGTSGAVTSATVTPKKDEASAWAQCLVTTSKRMTFAASDSEWTVELPFEAPGAR